MITLSVVSCEAVQKEEEGRNAYVKNTATQEKEEERFSVVGWTKAAQLPHHPQSTVSFFPAHHPEFSVFKCQKSKGMRAPPFSSSWFILWLTVWLSGVWASCCCCLVHSSFEWDSRQQAAAEVFVSHSYANDSSPCHYPSGPSRSKRAGSRLFNGGWSQEQNSCLLTDLVQDALLQHPSLL